LPIGQWRNREQNAHLATILFDVVGYTGIHAGGLHRDWWWQPTLLYSRLTESLPELAFLLNSRGAARIVVFVVVDIILTFALVSSWISVEVTLVVVFTQFRMNFVSFLQFSLNNTWTSTVVQVKLSVSAPF
jgi:hypothetical protein